MGFVYVAFDIRAYKLYLSVCTQEVNQLMKEECIS